MDSEDGSILLVRLLFLVVLILLNEFFAASEVALISLKPASIRKLAEASRKGKRLAKLTENSGRFLATVQLGVNLPVSWQVPLLRKRFPIR